jgi:hypothetical protein
MGSLDNRSQPEKVEIFDKIAIPLYEKAGLLGRLQGVRTSAIREKTGGCIIDGSTARFAAELLNDDIEMYRVLARPRISNTGGLPGRETFLYLLQNLIIFENVYVDWPLIAYNEGLYDAARMLEGSIVPLLLSTEERLDVAQVVDDVMPELWKRLRDLGDAFPIGETYGDRAESVYYNREVETFYDQPQPGKFVLTKEALIAAESVGGRLPESLPRFLRDSSNPRSSPYRTAF